MQHSVTNNSYPIATYHALVVGDDPASIRQMVSHLGQARMETSYSVDVTTALQQLRARHMHLVLIDLAHPAGSAQVLCEKIRAFSTTPIICLASTMTPQDERQMLKAGADDFLLKPYEPQRLIMRSIALLRRTYHYNHYDSATQTMARTNASEVPALPSNWAACESCSYMGPVTKFQGEDKLGHVAMICPHCRVPANITFAVS